MTHFLNKTRSPDNRMNTNTTTGGETMRHAKKPLALLLVLLMFVSLLPVGALAADAEPAEAHHG